MPTGFEVRPFLPIDLPLMRRLTPFGVSMDSMMTLTRGNHVLEGAVWGAMPLADFGTPTYVLRQGEQAYIGQFRHKNNDPHAHLVFLAPGVTGHEDEVAWMRLLDAMLLAAGKRSALTLNAEVSEVGPEFVMLRQAGFATYARQEIWRRPPAPVPMRHLRRADLLRPSTEMDSIALNSLYLNVVPRLVRQADASPDPRHGLVHTHRGRIMAYVNAQEGKCGTYLSAIFSPDLSSDQVQDLLASALCWLQRADKLPIYVCVRRYQEWLSTPLDSLAFSPLVSEAVMVRHTVRRVESVVLKPASVPEHTTLALPRKIEYAARWYAHQ